MIDPRNMDLHSWADAIVAQVSDAASVGRLQGDDWCGWAVGLVRVQPFAQRNLPDPYQFSDWREWATQAYPMLEVAG